MIVQDYQGKRPVLKPGSLLAPTAVVVGDVTVEEGASLWYGAAARGDQNSIHIGANTNIQENAVLHVSSHAPMNIGAWVSVGHGAILHGCTIEDECLIGMGAILMNGCVIGRGSIVAAGALVTENTVIPPNSLVMGSPAKFRRTVTPEEQEGNHGRTAHYRQRAEELLERQK